MTSEKKDPKVPAVKPAITHDKDREIAEILQIPCAKCSKCGTRCGFPYYVKCGEFADYLREYKRLRYGE